MPLNLDFSSFSAGAVSTLILVILIFARYPDSFQKWAGIVLSSIASIWKGAEYLSTKWEIQGKINSFVERLGVNTTATFPKIKLQWTGRNAKEELIWEENEVILVMRNKEHKNRNIVHAVYFFTSKALLKRAKQHLSVHQRGSLDLFATKKILEEESKAAVEQFMNDFFIPEVESEEQIRKLINKYVNIDRIGVFFPILIQELSYLGNKIFTFSNTRNDVENEVKALIDFLENFSHREIGDVKTPDEFIGKYTRCAIKIVASRAVRERGDITSQKRRISEVINKSFENVYVIGRNDDNNKEFIEDVCQSILEEFGNIQLTKYREFKSKIKNTRGEFITVGTYLAHLHSPNAVRYLYSEKELESA